jgi:ribosomal protein S18 acetylase RimI-like enzyme
MEIRKFQKGDEETVIRLWQDCNLVVPWNDPRKDIERKIIFQEDLFLVGIVEGRLVATVMAGYEGHRGWINYLAVSPDLQRKGLGRQMVQEAEKRLRVFGCPKINLQIRKTNSAAIDFYKSLGFSEDDVLSMGKRLEKD